MDGENKVFSREKKKKKELWFLRSAHRLILIDIYMKFREDSLNVFLRNRADMILWQSWGNNSKSIKVSYGSLCSACRLLLIDTYMKFWEESLNGFQDISGRNFVTVQGK